MHAPLRRSIHSLFSLLLAALLACPIGVAAQTDLPTRGTRFWTGFMQNGFMAGALKVHVMGASGTTGTVSIPLSGWSTGFTVGANNVAVIDVPLSAENSGSGNVVNKGVLIEAQDSVNVFISSFQNFTHDLSQILPEPSLGDSYRVDAYHGVPNFNDLHKSQLLIVATQDGTQVQITPTVPTASGQAANVPFTVDLDAGQTYQLQASQDDQDLTGTLVTATSASGSCRPFVVIGGSTCATMPGACTACDMIFEQLLPRSAWGTRFFTSPINGVNGSSYRILADVDNTMIIIDGGPPVILNAGQKHEVNGVAAPVCIQTSHPVSVVQMLEGVACAGNGDPSLLILSPHERLSTKASFNSPTSPQLSQHSIGLIVPPSAIGQVTLDGTVIDPSLFQSYNGCNDRKHARIVVTPGVHHVQADAGFQLYMFGIGAGESYASSVSDIAAVPLPQDSLVCGDSGVTLNAPSPLSNAEWTAASDPGVVLGTGNSLSITPTQSDSYTVTGEQPGTGCPSSFTYHVGIPLTVPVEPLANGQPALQICKYEEVQLSLDPPPDPAWFDVLWSPAWSLDEPTSISPIATPLESTWYIVEITSPTGCGSYTDSIHVEVLSGDAFEMSIDASSTVLCENNTIELSSTTLRVIANDRFNAPPSTMWASIQGGSVNSTCGSNSGTALYFNGGGQRYAQTIGLNTIGGGEIRSMLKIANGIAPCDDADPGENVVLEYSTSNGMSWNLIATYNENAYPEFAAIVAAIPPAAQSNNTMFRWRQLTNSGMGHDNWVLDDVLIARYDNNWLSYAWTPSGWMDQPTAATTMAQPDQSGWIHLLGTEPNTGCVYKDSIEVTVHPAFELEITADTVLCDAAGLQLNAVPIIAATAEYEWLPDDGSLSATDTPDPMASPQTTTTYSVTATSSQGCVATGEVTITVGQLIDLEVSAADSTICQGQQVQLHAEATGANGLAYAWSGGGLNDTSIADPVASPASTTTYTCTVTETASGCSVSESITIEVTTGYSADAGNDTTICTVLGFQLNVDHNVQNPSFQWSPADDLNNPNIGSPTILNDNSAIYTVTITDVNGCSVSDQVQITRAYENVPELIELSACADQPPLLEAPVQGVSYSWNTGQNTSSITPSATGNYTVTVINALGCEAITTFDVVLHDLPVVELGPDVALCGASDHELDAGNAGSTFQWTPSGSDQTLIVAQSGSYSVTVTNAHGCSASDQVNVQFDPLPIDVLEDVIACADEPPVIDAGNPGSTYLWNTGEQTPTIVPGQSGNYSVTITNAANCTATYDLTVTIQQPITVDLGNDTTICQGASLSLNAGNPGAQYEWSNAATSQTITVQNAGIFGVTVIDGACSASDAITVAITPSPIDMLNDGTYCIGEEVTLDAGNSGATYAWTDGGSAQSIDVNSSGTYGVQVTLPSGCTGFFEANVQFVPPPAVDLGPDTVLCDGQILMLDAGNINSTYAWNTGGNTRTIDVTGSGTYMVTVDNGHCNRSDEVVVYFNPSPEPIVDDRYQFCTDEEPGFVLLDAGNAGSEYEWSTDEVTRTIRAYDYGWYHVLITNEYGCSISDSVAVVEYCPAAIFAPNTFTPNGDGTNDIFIPVGKNIASMRLMIFDRWGTMLFQSDDPDTGWDGRYRGEFVTDDVYVWRLNYRFFEDGNGKLGMEQEMMGHIQVLR